MSPPRICRPLEHIARVLACMLAWQVLSACSRDPDPETAAAVPAAIAGTVTYRERIALTADALLDVQLLDVSPTDSPAVVISQQRIRNPGQVPIHFKLEYPANQINTRHRYTVQARLFEGEQLAFATDTAYPVITQGNPQIVEVAVIRVGSDPATASGDIPATEPPLEGTVTTGDVSARYAAYFADGKLISLSEDRESGAQGKVGVEYQFKGGRLLRYLESGSGAGGKIELNFVFDETGQLLAAGKTVNGAGEKPADAEISAARNRADLLRNHALALKASREHTQH